MNRINLQTRCNIGSNLAILIGAVLITSSLFANSAPTSIIIQRNVPAEDYLQALLRFEPWAESIWKDFPAIPGSGYFGDGASGGNGGIRGTTEIAFTYYVLNRAYPNAPQRQHRIDRIEAALRYAMETHQSNPGTMVAVDGKKWGVDPTISPKDRRGWQSGMWAAEIGFVAALMEKDLDPKVVEGCKRVIAAEADWREGIPPESRYKMNTASEETAWQSNILTMAAAWMPDDPRAKKWTEAAKLYMANTYTVPADSTGPLKEWIKTQTLYPSYTLENHGFFHPSYQISGIMSLGDSFIMAGMINPALAKELKPFLEFNILPVWQIVKGIIMDTGDLAFPSGMDWSLHQFEDVSCLAWMAVHFKMPEAQWAQYRVAKQILYRQAVNRDGRFVGESCENGFYVEAVQASVIALAYLHNEMAGFPRDQGSAPENNISHYPDIGLIFHRSDNTLTTISYGTKVMSLVYPLNGMKANQEYCTSPNTSSMIGTDGKAILKDFKITPAGFRAEFTLTGIKNGRNSRMVIVSEPEVVVYVEIPSDTSKLTLNEWYLTAIENHPLTGGEREVIWKGNSAKIKERSGASVGPVSSGWVNIDNWMGYIAVPEGNFVYQAAKDYNRTGAAEDAVMFIPKDNRIPRASVVLPAMNAENTAAVQKSLKWKVTGIECKISFNMPDGNKKDIRVPLEK